MTRAPFCLLGLALAQAQAATFVVRQEGPLRSVAEAVRSARAGDFIRIEPGVYQGNLLLDKTLVLEGSGRPVIRGDGNGSAIRVTAPGCTIRNLVIEHSGGMLVDEDSGILLQSDRNRIEHNELRDVLFGIYFFNSADNTVTDNFIRGRPERELGERGAGIHIWNSQRNTILRNTITQMRDGMYLQNASQSVISGNRIYNLRYGLHYMFSDDNKFEDNQFYDNVAGAAIMYSRRIEFRRNAFVHNRGFSSFGILFQDSDDCLSEYNAIVDNAVGIFLESLRGSVFRRNLVAANDIAIQAFSSASKDTFLQNNFIDNVSPVQVIGRQTEVLWSRGGTGNYWSEYDGYDMDGNGIGDVPFKIQNVFERMEGNYPRLRLYLFSPAARALALSEKMFPVIVGSREVDDHPLMKPVDLTGAPGVGVVGRWEKTPLQGLAFPAAMFAAAMAVIAKGRRR